MARSRITRTKQSLETYTTAEQDTGKVWVDGRTIYRKVVRGQFTVAVGANNVAHGISGLTSSLELVSMAGGIKLGATASGGGHQTLWYREAAGNWINPTGFDATNVVFTSSFAWGSSYCVLILEYVK